MTARCGDPRCNCIRFLACLHCLPRLLLRLQFAVQKHECKELPWFCEQKLMPGAVVDMVANVSRITGACQLLQGDATAQVQSRLKLPEFAANLQQKFQPASNSMPPFCTQVHQELV